MTGAAGLLDDLYVLDRVVDGSEAADHGGRGSLVAVAAPLSGETLVGAAHVGVGNLKVCQNKNVSHHPIISVIASLILLYRVTRHIVYYVAFLKLCYSIKRSLNCDRTFVLMSTKVSKQPDGSPCNKGSDARFFLLEAYLGIEMARRIGVIPRPPATRISPIS